MILYLDVQLMVSDCGDKTTRLRPVEEERKNKGIKRTKEKKEKKREKIAKKKKKRKKKKEKSFTSKPIRVIKGPSFCRVSKYLSLI